MKMKIACLISVLFSFSIQAAYTPPPEPPPRAKVFIDRQTTVDGIGEEFDSNSPPNNNPLGSVMYKDMGIELVTKKFKDTYYFEEDSTNIISKETTGFYFKIDSNHPTFRLGDKLRLEIRFKDKNSKDNKYMSYVHCRPSFPGIGTTCNTHLFSNDINIRRENSGELILPSYRQAYSYNRPYAYKRDANFEYFEVYVYGDYFSISDPAYKNAIPVLIVTADNSIEEASNSVVEMKNRSALLTAPPWNVYKPDAEAYIHDIPDVKPVIQIGASIQAPGGDFNFTVSSDFTNAVITFEPGASLNSDFEAEAFVNVFASTDVYQVTNGFSTTVSGDIGLVGGSLIYDDTNSLLGAGLTIGFGGIPDTDISINYPLRVDSTVDSGNTDSGGGEHNPNYGGNGDSHHGNDGNSGHAGGTSENSDGGTGVNTPWGGRSSCYQC